MSELKTCPFCGCRGETVQSKMTREWNVECMSCHLYELFRDSVKEAQELLARIDGKENEHA